MRPIRHILSSIRVVADFSGILAVQYLLPYPSLIAPNAFSAMEFIAFLIVPAALALIVGPILVSLNERRISPIALTVCASLCEGLSLGLSLSGLFVVYQWYVTPSASHLEPLLIMLGLLAAGTLTISRRLFALLTRLAEQPHPLRNSIPRAK